MLTIRPEQMHLFEREFFLRQAEFLYYALAPQYPERFAKITRAEGIEFVQRVLEKAHQDGFSQEHHASIYLGLAMRWGEDFRTLRWAEDVIRDKFMPNDLRAAELLERSNDRIVAEKLGPDNEVDAFSDFE